MGRGMVVCGCQCNSDDGLAMADGMKLLVGRRVFHEFSIFESARLARHVLHNYKVFRLAELRNVVGVSSGLEEKHFRRIKTIVRSNERRSVNGPGVLPHV